MTIREALAFAHSHLEQIEDSSLIIYSLLSFTIKLSKEYIWGHPDTLITQKQFDLFLTYIDRAAKDEPLAYIIGEKEFYNLPFFVTQDTLIPRPESERIIDLAQDFLKSRPSLINHSPTIIDVGTGSGCLAITLATLFPQARVYAIDISSKALDVAKRNAARHQVSNVTFLQGSLLEPLQAVLPGLKMDLVIANLPYISDVEFDLLPANVSLYEPELALRSGNDPDVLNRELIQQLPNWLAPQGRLIYETTNGHLVALDHV